MYTLPRTTYVKRSISLDHQIPITQRDVLSAKDRIRQQLRSLGVSHAARHSMEARYLPHIIHTDEYIQGVVYGKSEEGLAMLVATDKRAIYLDKKFLFVNVDEITFDVVSGVNHSHVGLGSTITLHTRIKDYTLKTMNEKCAQGFVKAIESRCVEQSREENRHDYNFKNRFL